MVNGFKIILFFIVNSWEYISISMDKWFYSHISLGGDTYEFSDSIRIEGKTYFKVMNKNTYTSSTECKKENLLNKKTKKKSERKNPMLQTKFLFVFKKKERKKSDIYFFFVSVLNREHQAKQYDVIQSWTD